MNKPLADLYVIIGQFYRPLIVILVPDGKIKITNTHAPDNSSISVTWTGLSEKEFQGAPQGYKILYKETNDMAPCKVLATYGVATSTVIKDLKPGMKYTLRVLAFNVYGDGRPSAAVNVTTQGSSVGKFFGVVA